MDQSMSLELLAYRALVKLGHTDPCLGSLELFQKALEDVSVYDDEALQDGILLRAALAIHSFDNVNRGDYGDTYKSAATVIEMDALDEPWEPAMLERGPSADDVAEVLERMLFDAALSIGQDWEKEDEDELQANRLEQARRKRNARRRARRRELKQLALTAAAAQPEQFGT
ncbi:hypothetical protein [uncultured Devosia sp.]|jgi:hypothetical protein|uniref:hypothetical protein n=2 Tax=Devosia TaxID=46913 RepID=UPI0030EF9067|tara:strand:- start:3197 stop:3709 length:513 start_codon:yes stop_codon:yes gene_type:complete